MGKLFIIATPIGNLGDITYRAIETLRQIDIIACEDTRLSRKLLNHYDIHNKKLYSHHNNNEQNSSKGLINLLISGNDIALLSDAGTPLISDPGFILVRECIKNNIKIEVLPGPSATIVAAILSNMNLNYTFLGFLKPKTQQRKNQLQKLNIGTFISYVSPHKLIQTLEDIKSSFGSNTNIFIGKEFTKIHEKHFWGSVENALLEDFVQSPKGEYTIVFEKK